MRQHAKNAAKIALNYHGQRESLVRQYFFMLAGRYTPTVSVDTGDLRFHMTTSESFGRVDFGIGGLDEEATARSIATLGTYTGVEHPLKDRVLLDVGGHIGTTSVAAVRRFGAKRSYAFEPSPVNRRMLRLNVAENGVGDAVTVFGVALSDADGEVEFEVSSEHAGDHRVRVGDGGGQAGEMGEDQREVLKVPARRLDSLVAAGEVELDDVALLWMDVQGHEGHVLAGASQALARGIPVMMEYWPYGLRRAGGFDLLHNTVAQSFSRVIDLGPPWEERPPVELPASDMAKLAPPYEGALRFSDLLLIP
jgi:FkbM family methyltransferase